MNLYAPWPDHEGDPLQPPKVEGWLLALFALVVFVIFMFGAIAASHSQERHGGSGVHRGAEHGFSGHPGGSQGHAGVWRHPYGGGGSWGHRNDDFGAGVLGGLIGGAIGSIFAPDPEPPAVVVIQPPPEAPVGPKPWSQEWYDFCNSKYKSFDAKTGYYTGYDGIQHFCN